MASAIELRHVTKRFLTPSGTTYTALRDIDLAVQEGEFCAVVGPTGCGKSTTLALISGLEPPSGGEVRVRDEIVRGVGRDVGYVFQVDAVFPWKSVLDNVATGPRFRGVTRRDADERARDWIKRVGLAGFERYYPHQLSGGMRKRAALAQTLINEPRILLMDEPFSALDVQTRALMENELLDLWASTRASVVFVTHDLEEAIALADRVVVITAGPGTVKGTYRVDLPRPRNIAEVRFQPRFVELYEEIWNQLVTWVEKGTAQGPLWEQIAVTLEETVLGFAIGVILGIIFGVVLGRNRLLADVLGPYIKGLNAMPRVVLGSIFTIALGLEIPSKVALAVVLVFFVVFFNAFQGVREVDRELLANARILGASQGQLSRHVILPSALSWILASLHTSFGFALVGAIVGEYLGARKGIGLMIATAQGTFNANGVFAAMLILAIVAILAEALVTRLETSLIKWRPNAITDVTI